MINESKIITMSHRLFDTLTVSWSIVSSRRSSAASFMPQHHWLTSYQLTSTVQSGSCRCKTWHYNLMLLICWDSQTEDEWPTKTNQHKETRRPNKHGRQQQLVSADVCAEKAKKGGKTLRVRMQLRGGLYRPGPSGPSVSINQIRAFSRVY